MWTLITFASGNSQTVFPKMNSNPSCVVQIHRRPKITTCNISLIFLALFGLAFRGFSQNAMASTNTGTVSADKYAAPAMPPAGPLMLWYRQPADRQWTEALPIGNGRLGAMVFGGVERERLQLNEDTLWAGGPYDPDNHQRPRRVAGSAPAGFRRANTTRPHSLIGREDDGQPARPNAL